MPNRKVTLISRRAVSLTVLGLALSPLPLRAAEHSPSIVVHKDPACGCCGAWAKHLMSAGLSVTVDDTTDLSAIRSRLGVPHVLAACHTAEVEGYVVEGHVPAAAIQRLLRERPDEIGIAVPGMPSGSPGMGGKPEQYSVTLFGHNGVRAYMQFRGSEPIN
ncbi:MAG: DUF411 domain-containing protein [Rhodopseudomonas palustris]|uniref:DUF411 domain-containing protein n=1 Tax=Rhodopseudomonas palustris TaxID=1076 RepID=A0A933RUK9_RHOPL|nr:DUF411 domain-containing protein [Rhodopseudomonas palustris]